jgi:hypothetical protein
MSVGKKMKNTKKTHLVISSNTSLVKEVGTASGGDEPTRRGNKVVGAAQ